MSEEKEETDPLEIMVISKKTTPNQPVQPNQINRNNTSFHILPQIANGFRTYAKHTGKPVGECVEQALIEYMQNHPTPQIKLNIQQHQPNTNTDIQNRLRNKILTSRIQGTIQILRHLNKTKTGDKTYYQIQLRKLVLQAASLRNPDEYLLRLMEEAEDFI